MPKYKGQMLKKMYVFILLLYVNNVNLSQSKVRSQIGYATPNQVYKNSALYRITSLTSYLLGFFDGSRHSLKKSASKGFNYSALCYYILATTLSVTSDSFEQFKFSSVIVKGTKPVKSLRLRGKVKSLRRRIRAIPKSILATNKGTLAFSREFLSLWGRFLSYKEKQKYLVVPE